MLHCDIAVQLCLTDDNSSLLALDLASVLLCICVNPLPVRCGSKVLLGRYCLPNAPAI